MVKRRSTLFSARCSLQMEDADQQQEDYEEDEESLVCLFGVIRKECFGF